MFPEPYFVFDYCFSKQLRQATYIHPLSGQCLGGSSIAFGCWNRSALPLSTTMRNQVSSWPIISFALVMYTKTFVTWHCQAKYWNSGFKSSINNHLFSSICTMTALKPGMFQGFSYCIISSSSLIIINGVILCLSCLIFKWDSKVESKLQDVLTFEPLVIGFTG